MNEKEYQDRIRELERALRYAGECTLDMVRDTVRGAVVLDAPTSGTIVRPVAWHPGGAKTDPATGEPYPWPYGWSSPGPEVVFAFKVRDDVTITSQRVLYETDWPDVDYWCNPVDLEPPAIG